MLLRFPLWKVALVVLGLLIGIVLALPNVVPAKYMGWLPFGPMKLGLDLQGGASVLLEIDPVDLKRNKLNELSRDIRSTLGQRPRIVVEGGRAAVENGQAVLRLRDPSQMQEAVQRIAKLGAPPVGVIGARPSLVVTSQPNGTITVDLTQQALDKLRVDALANSIEAVERRINNSGVTEPTIQQQGENRILVELPGEDDPGPLIDVLTQAGVLTFNMVDVSANPADYPQDGQSANGRRALPNDDPQTPGMQVILDEPVITGSDLQTASQSFDQSNNPNITFQLRPQGAARFGKETTENVGRPFAIVLDDRIVSAPTIRSPITGGSGVIEGNFTIQEAENLAIILRSGALPAKLQVADSRVVGAGLGADSIRMGVTASLVGVALITIFMLIAYGLLGVFALVALYLNLVLIVGILSGFGATLTLPGIAGMLLTLGMAVDANVLVFERIREEQRNGRSAITAVEAGYEHAMATIIDASVTHLVAALIMFNLGSGAIKGFALTLAIGVLTSMFTAVLVARWFTAIWMRAARPKWIPI